MGTCCSSSGISSGAPWFGDLGAQAPGLWLLGDSQGTAGGRVAGARGEHSWAPCGPCGLCGRGRGRPLADLGLGTCIFAESGRQAKPSAAGLPTGLRSGAAMFTGSSVAIAPQDPCRCSILAPSACPPAPAAGKQPASPGQRARGGHVLPSGPPSPALGRAGGGGAPGSRDLGAGPSPSVFPAWGAAAGLVSCEPYRLPGCF